MQIALCLKTGLLVIAVLTSPGALAASIDDFPPCGTFTLTGGDYDNFVLDFATNGDTDGDARIGEREFLDENGNVVGMARWVTTVIDTKVGDGDDTLALAENVYSLPDGTIHAEGLLQFEAVLKAETEPDSTPTTTPMAILGATGAYMHSEGEVEITFTPGKLAKYVFKLHCD